MMFNSIVVDNSGNEVFSFYRELWYNFELNNYIDVIYCINEQFNFILDGVFENGLKI